MNMFGSQQPYNRQRALEDSYKLINNPGGTGTPTDDATLFELRKALDNENEADPNVQKAIKGIESIARKHGLTAAEPTQQLPQSQSATLPGPKSFQA
jgi:hypothetical protein